MHLSLYILYPCKLMFINKAHYSMSMLLVLSSQLLPVRTPPRSPERGASSSLYVRTGVHQYVLF